MINIQNYAKAPDLMLRYILLLSPWISGNVQRKYYSSYLLGMFRNLCKTI